MGRTVLVIDDEETVRLSLRQILEDAGCKVDIAVSGQDGLRLVRNSPTRYAAIFVDYNLAADTSRPNERGDFVVKRIKEINSDLEVIIISGDASSEAFRAWADAGVDNYLYKPIEPDKILTLLEGAISRHSARFQFADEEINRHLDEKSRETLRKTGLIGASRALVNVANDTLKFAPKNNTILILGETGSGKELIANAIHENSPRRRAMFIAINCANYKGDTQLLESELFGYEKGAFTGADKTTAGIFESANGGTVFLDEIHHLSAVAQAKLLRVVQEKKVRRVGGKVELKVDFRIIAAAKPELRTLVEQGDFSPDLYYRIKDLVITVPPLRMRIDDVKPLIFHFRAIIEKRDNVHKEFEEACVERLRSYNWPGNVRELERLIDQLYAKVDGNVIRSIHLPEEILKLQNTTDADAKADRRLTLGSLATQFENQQRELIVRALRLFSGNITKAAESLGVPRTSLNSLIKKFQIPDTNDSGESNKAPGNRNSWLRRRGQESKISSSAKKAAES